MARVKKKASTKTRVTLDLNTRSYRRLVALQDLVGAESKAGVLRQALELLEFIARKTGAGYVFKAIDPKGKVEWPIFVGLSGDHCEHVAA